MKKFLFLIALFTLMGGVNSVKATRTAASFSVATGCSWNAGTNTMSFTAVNGWQILNTGFPGGDISAYTKFHATLSDMSDNIENVRLRIKDKSDKYADVNLVVGENNIDLAALSSSSPCDFSNINDITIWSPTAAAAGKTVDGEHTASVKITDCYLYKLSNRELDVKLSTLPASSENTTWDNSTKTFAWSNTSWNSTELFGAGNYSSYTTLNFETTAGTANHFRVIVTFTNGAGQVTINPVAVGKESITLADYISLENLANVKSIRLSGANDATGNIKVSRIYLEGPNVNNIEDQTVLEVPVGGQDINGMTGEGSFKWSVNYPKQFGPGQEFVCGNLDGDDKSLNIESYDYLHLVVTSVETGKKLSARVFTSEEYHSGTAKRHCLYARPITDAVDPATDWEAVYYISAPGTYVVKIADYPLLRGVKGGNGWGGDESNGSITVSLSYFTTGSTAEPVENVARVGEEALTDAHATCFDVTGLDGTGITLNPTNSNALFIANAGVLTNANNVIVSGTCVNLALTDGNYPFRAADTFTATNVSYNRSFTAGTRSTVCLPFALTAAEAEAAGTFYELSGVSVAGTELTFEAVSGGTTAYKPYIFEANADGAPFSVYSNKAIAITPATLTGETVEDYTLTGVLAGSSDVAADNDGKTVYGWSGNDGNEGVLVKVGTGVAINPFRAYVVYNGGGASLARMAARFVSGSVTGINEVSETQNVLNPDRKYIENGKIVIVKNGVKYNAAGQLLK